MGCFSYICPKCNKSIRDEEGVKLFVLQGGKVLEEMEGNYTLYGKVDDKKWTNDWSIICDLIFNNHPCDGMAAIHSDCWDGEVPTECSDGDEKQGCGKKLKSSTTVSEHTFYELIQESARDIEDAKKMEEMSKGLNKLIESTRKLLDELNKHN